MPRTLCSLLVSGLLLGATVPTLDGADLARVKLTDAQQLDVLLRSGFDVVQTYQSDPATEAGPPAADVILKRGEEQELLDMGFRVEILDRDYEAALASRLRPLTAALGIGPPGYGQGAMGGYYTFSEIVATIDHYVTNYPTIVSQKLAVGTTHEGRTIWAIKVSDNPNVTENEPRVLFDSLHHAREPMSAHTLLWLLDYLATGYGNDSLVTQLVDSREIWMVPCVNPDGYVYNEQQDPNGGGLWRKNRRNNPGSCDGVDLNRNWPSFWGWDNVGSSTDTCSETYRGPSAMSEPETQAMDAFMTGKGFNTAWSMHCFGEWLLEPYGYKSGNPASSPEYDEYSADMAAFNGYIAGPGYNLLYPANGIAIDHYHEVHGAVAYTPEIGTSFWPPISAAVGTAMLNVEPALLMIKYAGTWLTTLDLSLVESSGDGDEFAEPGETFDVVITIRNKGQDSTGGPVSLNLSSPSASANVLVSNASIGNLDPLQNGSNAATPLRVQIAADATPGVVNLVLAIGYSTGGQVELVPLTIGKTRTIHRDDLESDLGWTAGVAGDNPTTGAWERADPSQKSESGTIIQPGNDATPAPGTLCYVTDAAGGSAGNEDVDEGPTTLLTPVFDASAAADPIVRYARFYYCDDGDDFLDVDISSDGGQSWFDLESVPGNENAWTTVEFRVADFVPPTAQMRVRFVASDVPNNSVTEALVDDFELLDFGAAPHLGVFGTPGIGDQVELQVAGDPGATWLLYLSFGTASNSLPGVSGTFGLDPSTLLFLFSAPIAADGLTRIPVTIPNDPGVVGAQAYLQAIVNAPPAVLSNVASITITN